MAELIDLRGAELGNVRKKPKPQILGADVGQKIRVQRHVFRPHPADQHALAAASRFVRSLKPKSRLSDIGSPLSTRVATSSSVARFNVRFGLKADICSAKGHVRFTPRKRTFSAVQLGCPLSANSGHSALTKRKTPGIKHA